MNGHVRYLLTEESGKMLAIPFSSVKAVLPVTRQMFPVLQDATFPIRMSIHGKITEVRTSNAHDMSGLKRGTRIVMLENEPPVALLCSLVIDSCEGEMKETPYGQYITYQGQQVRVYERGER